LLIYNLSRAYHQMADQFHAEVRRNGLTVQEWRILASLHGEATRELEDLAARTFIEKHSLLDMLATMQDEGLCVISDQFAGSSEHSSGMKIFGTAAGHARVEHLFQQSQALEFAAIGNAEADALPSLLALLKLVIGNTRPLG